LHKNHYNSLFNMYNAINYKNGEAKHLSVQEIYDVSQNKKIGC